MNSIFYRRFFGTNIFPKKSVENIRQKASMRSFTTKDNVSSTEDLHQKIAKLEKELEITQMWVACTTCCYLTIAPMVYFSFLSS